MAFIHLRMNSTRRFIANVFDVPRRVVHVSMAGRVVLDVPVEEFGNKTGVVLNDWADVEARLPAKVKARDKNKRKGEKHEATESW